MIKLGFLGGGIESIAGKVHLIASQMDNNFKVIGGIFSKDKKKSLQSAKIYKVKHFSSIDDMAKEVDIIVLLTPTPNHYGDLKQILKYDVGIIVDKPLFAYPKALDFSNKFVIVTHNYSGYPLVREIRELISHGYLGNIKKISIRMYQESFFKPMKPGYPQQWRLKDEKIPTLALDLGVHTYHLATFLLQKNIVPFFCEKNNFSKYNVVDDCIVLAKQKNILVELAFSKIMLGNTNPLYIDVYGDKAGIKWSQDDFEHLYITHSNGHKEILNRSFAYFEANKPRYQRMAPGHPSGFIEAFANLYQDIYESFVEYKTNKTFTNKFVYDYKHSIESLKFFKEIV
jgi:predicted dehydrogenase